MTAPSIVPVELLHTAVLNTLRAGINSGGGSKRVFDTRFKGKSPSFPYYTLAQIPGGAMFGPGLTAPDADAAVMFQLTSYHLRRDAVQQVAAIAREVMVGRNASGAFKYPMAISGWSVCDRVLSSALGGVDVTGEPPNEVFAVPEIYAVHVTPA